MTMARRVAVILVVAATCFVGVNHHSPANPTKIHAPCHRRGQERTHHAIAARTVVLVAEAKATTMAGWSPPDRLSWTDHFESKDCLTVLLVAVQRPARGP